MGAKDSRARMQLPIIRIRKTRARCWAVMKSQQALLTFQRHRHNEVKLYVDDDKQMHRKMSK